jgi:hypothetical protein
VVVIRHPTLSIEVGEDGEYATIVVFGRRKAQLREDVGDVFGDRAVADVQLEADGGVGAALGHQLEYVVLAGRQLGDSSACVVAGK